MKKQGETRRKRLKQYIPGSMSRQPRGLWKLFNFLLAVKRYRRLVLIKQTQWHLYAVTKEKLNTMIFCTPGIHVVLHVQFLSDHIANYVEPLHNVWYIYVYIKKKRKKRWKHNFSLSENFGKRIYYLFTLIDLFYITK